MSDENKLKQFWFLVGMNTTIATLTLLERSWEFLALSIITLVFLFTFKRMFSSRNERPNDE
jgi:membrane protein implicated in regulation of membrane protease activity